MLQGMIGRELFPDPRSVLLEPPVVQIFDRYRQDLPHSPEAGGILLGYRRGHALHVIAASEPTSKDRRSRTAFERRPTGHRGLARAHWHVSGGTVDYLGEWHTHPEDHPRPSSVDRAAWRALAQQRAPLAMLFVIVGRAGRTWCGLATVDTMVNLPIERFDATAADDADHA